MQPYCCKDKMVNIAVKGISWIKQSGYNTDQKKISGNFEKIEELYKKLKDEKIFMFPVKNFSRFDKLSKVTCCLIALALKDAGIKYYQERKQNIGIIGTNKKGCLNSNLAYFKDYLQAGRKLSRGNLFIYTLPSSSLAEAAIHFNLQGELIYVNFLEDQTSSLLSYAAEIFSSQGNKAMLAINADENGGTCFVLANEEKTSNLNDLIMKLKKGRG